MTEQQQQASELVVIRSFPVEPARVFEAWRRTELLGRWFGNAERPATVTCDFRVGGRYRIEMEDAGARHVQFGQYLEIREDVLIRFTWTCLELSVTDSVVTVELRATDEGTDMKVIHRLPPDPEIVRLHEGGWHACFARLAPLLETL